MQMILSYWLKKKWCYRGMINRLIEIGKCYAMKLNVENIR